MSIATRIALGWLMDNKAHLPPDLLIPFAAGILRRQVTPALISNILHLDTLLDDQERLRTVGSFHDDGPSDSLRIVHQDIEDTLTALHRLPGYPRVGDKVQIDVGDPMMLDRPSYPGVVVGYNDGTSVRVVTRQGEQLRTAAQCRVTDRAVYVPATAPDGAS